MHKLILEACDGKGDSIYEPVFLETLHDLPMGVKQAVEDFIDAHDGEVVTPIVVTARVEGGPETSCAPLVEAAPAAHNSSASRKRIPCGSKRCRHPLFPN